MSWSRNLRSPKWSSIVKCTLLLSDLVPKTSQKSTVTPLYFIYLFFSGCKCILFDVANYTKHCFDDDATEIREKQENCSSGSKKHWHYLYGTHSLDKWPIFLLLLGRSWIPLSTWCLAYPYLSLFLQFNRSFCLLWCCEPHAR